MIGITGVLPELGYAGRKLFYSLKKRETASFSLYTIPDIKKAPGKKPEAIDCTLTGFICMIFF